MSVARIMFGVQRGGDYLVNSVGGLAEAARLVGVRPSVLLDLYLCALEDEAWVDVQRAS